MWLKPGRMSFTLGDVRQHSLRLVYWIKHQTGINGIFFAPDAKREGWQVAAICAEPVQLMIFPCRHSFQCPLKSLVQVSIQRCRRHGGKRKTKPAHGVIRGRKKEPIICSRRLLLLPFPNPILLPWQCPVDEGECSVLLPDLLEVAGLVWPCGGQQSRARPLRNTRVLIKAQDKMTPAMTPPYPYVNYTSCLPSDQMTAVFYLWQGGVNGTNLGAT